MTDATDRARARLILTVRRWAHRQRDEQNVVVSDEQLLAVTTTYESALAADAREAQKESQ